MNAGQLVYSVPTGQPHSFQVNKAQVVGINSTVIGITVGSSTLATQTYITSQGYITSSPTGITLTGIHL